MKIKLIYFLAFIVALTGCDKIKDATTVDIDTNLYLDIPVVVQPLEKKLLDQAGNVNAIEFSKSMDLFLSSNTDIEPYLEKIKEINLNSLFITVTGLVEDQTINTLALDVAGVGNIFTQNNITMINNSFTPEILTGTLAKVAEKLNNDKKITITVYGNASGPMSFVVSCNFVAKVIANVL